MTDPTSPTPDVPGAATRRRRRLALRSCSGCCGCGCLAPLLLLFLAGWLILQRVPATFPLVKHPIPPPAQTSQLGGGLDGFESPYIGHTGSWNGQGGAMAGPKTGDMDLERSMGLRWTFMPVYWRKLEPDGPVDPNTALTPAWRELDAFVVSAHERGLNILMQAPVVGGNAGGPPKWAGRRESGKAAPRDMKALAEFAGKLAARYRPGGVLARREGWGNRYGVRAWEIDNEPADYLVNWSGQAGDYAEFVTGAAHRIREEDPLAVIVAPSLATGGGKYEWLEQALDGKELHGSPEYRRASRHYSVGPPSDVVSFHLYEGLDTAFTGRDRTMDRSFSEVRSLFEKWEKRTPGHRYARKQEYWHTEGSFDFFGVLSAERRAAWRFQFFTRSFAAGIRKVVVMDPSRQEQTAIRTYVSALPDPFPMVPAQEQLRVLRGKVTAFRHDDRTGLQRRVWVLWAQAGGEGAEVEVPARGSQVEVFIVRGKQHTVKTSAGKVRIQLDGDKKMAPPVLVIEGGSTSLRTP